MGTQEGTTCANDRNRRENALQRAGAWLVSVREHAFERDGRDTEVRPLHATLASSCNRAPIAVDASVLAHPMRISRPHHSSRKCVCENLARVHACLR
eukprot:6188764-Pleurochrysis_carterae.AAC.1